MFSKVQSKKIIKFRSCLFGYVEDESYKNKHPIENYYFCLHDLSINAQIAYKWVLFGYFFFDALSQTITQESNSERGLKQILEEKHMIPIFYVKKHQLLLDNLEIKDKNHFLLTNGVSRSSSSITGFGWCGHW